MHVMCHMRLSAASSASQTFFNMDFGMVWDGVRIVSPPLSSFDNATSEETYIMYMFDRLGPCA
jgi:hypothetical protein